MDFIFDNLELVIFAVIVFSQILAAIAKDKKKRQQQQQQQPQQGRSQDAGAGTATSAPASSSSQTSTDFFEDGDDVVDDVYNEEEDDVDENVKILEDLGIVVLDQQKPQSQTSTQTSTTQTQTHHRTTYSPPPPKPVVSRAADIDCEWERAIIEKEAKAVTRAAERAADTALNSKIYDRNQIVKENELAKRARDGFVWMEILREPVSMRE